MTRPRQTQTAKHPSNGSRPAQPARPASTAKRPAAPGPGSLSASAKQRRITEMLQDIRSGITQLSSNADILRGRFS